MDMKQMRASARTLKPCVIIGKNGLTLQQIEEVKKVLKTRKLVKIKILNNCNDDPKAMAASIAEQTKSKVVSVIGKMIVVWKG